jgi:2-polyprenyl-3-methyl-5-hydroxy-6-metoxy-1,4-benzoquinol methylase
MEPNAFITEVYRRMRQRHAQRGGSPDIVTDWDEMSGSTIVQQSVQNYQPLLPPDKDAAILDIGTGAGWFLAAAVKLGYTNLNGADFGAGHKSYMKQWSPAIREIHNIETHIGDFLSTRAETYDVIHLSHVIEHVPKHSLLYIVDALYLALKPGGTLILRTPNMEGPCALSIHYVTLGHEYGFAGSNLVSLLDICQFDEIALHRFRLLSPTLKQWTGIFLRWPFIAWNSVRHRLFGVNRGGVFSQELIVTAKRGEMPPLFDEKYR